MSLGTKIKALREEKNLSQKELANIVDVSTGTIAEWEADEAQPNIAVLANLSKALSVTTDELLETKFEETAPPVKQSSVTATTTPSKKQSKRFKAILSAVACIVVVAMVILFFMGKFDGLFAAFMPEETLAFSDDTTAIENADASVVTLFCYDGDGELAATGSGFLAFNSKTIITNYHVMESAYTCKVSTNQDIFYDVSYTFCYSKDYDIAIIGLKEDTGLAPLPLGSTDDIKKGEPVVAIGSPLGVKNTVSSGILSGRIMEDSMYVLQFTAPISSGSSGGALFDDDGNVIGVTYASYVDGQNLNLAIPIEHAIKLYEERKGADRVFEIYNIENPNPKYLVKYKDAPVVTVDDLKENPKQYDENYVRLFAYISSIEWESAEYGYRCLYLAEETNITFDYEHDEWLCYVGLSNIAFENHPILKCTLNRNEYRYVDTEIKEGDRVEVIGYFNYTDKEELMKTAEDADEESDANFLTWLAENTKNHAKIEGVIITRVDE